MVIDCFTKKIWAVPMRNKTGEWTAQSFQSILDELPEMPVHIITDRGTGIRLSSVLFELKFHSEFFNTNVKTLFINHGINHYAVPTKSPWKASMVERVIQTLKTKLERYFTKNKTKKYIDVLDDFVKNYNKTPHRSHGFAPLDVNAENTATVYKKMFPDLSLKTICKLKVGDKVRKIRGKGDWEKGYKENWSDEIFTISKIRQQSGVCWYYLVDHENEKIKGIYYYYQLNLVARNEKKDSS